MRHFSSSVYEYLVNEEERVCTDIDDQACRETPRNFLLILATYLATKLGDALASPKTVLPWVLNAIAAPSFFTGLVVPIREAGSMVPQLFIAAKIRQLSIRKWAYVLGCIAQAVSMGGIAATAYLANGAFAGWLIILLLTIFSLSRGVCSIASKDVLGKTIPKRRRGRLTGWASSGAGLISMSVGLGFILFPSSKGDQDLGLLIAAAAALWILAAVIYRFVVEYPGETSGGANAWGEAWERLSILRSDVAFRRFVIVRALLLSSALSGPYYILLAQRQLGQQLSTLGWFIAAAGAASLISAPVWGQFADRSSRRVMQFSAAIVSVLGIAVIGLYASDSSLLGRFWLIPALYFVLSIAHAGARVGRKTYVVDLAKGNKRTDYVAVSNTVIGLLLLLIGLVSALLSMKSLLLSFIAFTAMSISALLLANWLPEAE
ncbi:MAG: MFS transporter [Wenzhouxiangellaceae bacterium]